MLNRLKRMVKHRWQDDSIVRRAIPADMLQRLGQRVTASEQQHSGEIRIFIESSLPLSYLWRNAPTHRIIRERALAIFGKLRVWDTANNNGVLIYLLLAEQSIEIVADRGLNPWVDQKAWQAIMVRMRVAFQQGHFEAGLMQALETVTALLVQHFPLTGGQANPNELPDTPILS